MIHDACLSSREGGNGKNEDLLTNAKQMPRWFLATLGRVGLYEQAKRRIGDLIPNTSEG